MFQQPSGNQTIKMANLWNQLWYSRASDYLFARLPQTDSDGSSMIVPNKDYLKVYLTSLTIPYNRKGVSKFHGAVHSFLSLPYLSDPTRVEVHRILVPQKLKDIDANNVDRVISLNQILVGPIPFRGGDLEFQVGLFSLKSADLSVPFLNLLEGLSNAFGVSYFTSAVPFLEPLKLGISMLTNSSGNAELEIGISGNLRKPETGRYVAIAADKEDIDLKNVSFHENDYSLKFPNGKSYAYLVLEIVASNTHETWFQIPEINQAYTALKVAVRAGDYTKANELLVSFSRIAKTCPDLHFEDGERLSKLVEEQTRKILGTTQVANDKEYPFPDIETIDPFSSKANDIPNPKSNH